MLLISWNVNGIRAVQKKGFIDWVLKENPDVLCLQETKAHPDQLDDELKNIPGYHVTFDSAEKKGYSGTATYSKIKPNKTSVGLGKPEFDTEGRVVRTDFDQFVLFNIYFPNGGRGDDRVKFKLDFYDEFLNICEQLRREGKHVICCGDYNTAHKEIDLARPKQNRKTSGFLPIECEWLDKYTSMGYIDTFREFNQQPDQYSWWDQRFNSRANNVGWRIDYFFITPELRPNLTNAFIRQDVMGSDHCPVGIELKF